MQTQSVGAGTPRWTPALLDAFGSKARAQYAAGDVIPVEVAGCQERGAPSRPNIYNANIHDYKFCTPDEADGTTKQ